MALLTAVMIFVIAPRLVTERRVNDAIAGLQLTRFVIAHRPEMI